MPGGDKNIRPEDGKQFSSTYQPANRGRKPKVFSQIAKEFKALGIEEATPAVVQEAYQILLALPMSDIQAISSSPKLENDMPILYRLAANLITSKRGLDMLKEMLDRAHGRPQQKTDITTGGEKINSALDGLSIETKAQILRLINEEKQKSEPKQ